MKPTLSRRLAAEFLGTAFLVAAVVGELGFADLAQFTPPTPPKHDLTRFRAPFE
jgi:glycerol uptake facilitator-like aquaporin